MAIQASPIGLAGRVTISIGVVQFQGQASPEALIQQADLALYRAKRNGRDRVEVHLPAAGNQAG
jgi:diguanylate cyclase (GGDEF)-like protein